MHVRRLRAKLGPEREALIGTVRNVGYKFVAQPLAALRGDDAEDEQYDGVDGVDAESLSTL